MPKRNRRKLQPIRNLASGPALTPQSTMGAHEMPKRSFRLICLGLLAAIGLCVYANSFQNEMIWDDLVIIPPNEYIQTFDAPKIFTTDVHHFSYQPSNFYRPLQMLSYAVNYRLGGTKPLGYHLVNTFIHILNAWLLVLIFLRLNERLLICETNKWKGAVLVGAAVWLVHPIHTQNTTYISGRADLLVAFFALACIYTYASQKNRWITLGLFVGALLSKESAMIIPLFFVLYDILIGNDGKWGKWGQRELSQKSRKFALSQISGLLPYFVVLGIYAALRLTIFNFPTAFTTDEVPSLGPRLLTSAVSIVRLWGILLVPIHLSMLRNIDWATSLASPQVLICLALVLALLTLMIRWRRSHPFVSFCLGWYFITYIPVLNIMPMNANMSEHWMYLPSMALIMLTVYGLFVHLFRQRLRFLIALLVPVILIYSVLLFKRNAEFADPIVFFEKLLEQRPDNTRAHYNLGTAYGLLGDYAKARRHFEDAIKYDPKYAPAYANLGLIEARENNVDRAIELYEKANALQDNLIENHANLGIAYARKNDSAKAVAAFEKTLTLNPKHAAALNGLGIEYAKGGDLNKAEDFFKRVLALYPNHPDGTNNLKRLQAMKK